LEQGCQIFFIAYDKNPDKNFQNDCFLKKLWPKSLIVLTIVISAFIGVLNCLEGGSFLPKNVVLPKKQAFTF